MVQAGWALASTTGSTTYLKNEEVARASEAGLWAGAFVTPLDWRQHNWHAKILGKATVQTQTSALLFNVGIWHLSPLRRLRNQGQRELEWEMHISYAGWPLVQTNNDGSKYGDRWFCTPIEAIASGCRETQTIISEIQ